MARPLLHFIASGQLVMGRPAARDKKVRVILAHEQTPGVEHKAYLLQLQKKAATENVQFVWGDKSEVLALASAT